MALREQDSPFADCAAEGSSGAFPTTLWTEVLSAGKSDPARAGEAMEQLCGKYWYPIYAFIRWRRVVGHHEAEDLTQGFFEHLLEMESLKAVAREKGKFRSFLLASLSNFLNDERDRTLAVKRGGNRQFLSWDGLTPEEKYRNEPTDPSPPERFFDRTWGFALFEQACCQLRQQYRARHRLDLFQELKPFLTEMPKDGFYEQAAARLGMRAETVRVALHRLRRELGQCLRAEIAATVCESADVNDELRFLISVVGQ